MKLPEAGRLVRLAVVGLTLACGHTEPFGTQGYDTDQPFDPTPPLRLTLNRGPDRSPAWLSNGSGILYSTQLSGARDNDVCLALLPPTGGRQQALTCTLSSRGDQLREAIESAAPDSAGRLAFIFASSAPDAVLPASQSLVLATVDRPAEYRPLLALPYTSASGRLTTGISQLHWSGTGRLVFLAEQISTRRPCDGCQLDTIRAGLEAVSLAVDQAPTAPEFVAGTDFASGVSPGSNDHEIYYTLGGDTRVYRKDLLTGDLAVAYDFGAAGLARDVDVVGSRMAAVVGGRASFSIDPSLGPVQWDSGGILHVVDLQTGSDVVLDGPGLFRRPRLSPDGVTVVAELYPLIITNVEGIQDTTVSREADLYLLGRQ
jgi:hypothetical protein